MFLLEKDYITVIQEDILNDIVRGDRSLLELSEAAAISEMKAYLNMRYDTAKVFPDLPEWNSEETYEAGMHAVEGHYVYLAKVENLNKLPSESPAEWKKDDPRNPHMVILCTYITLYNAHMATSPDSIPSLRVENRDLAIKYLEKVAEGKLQPDLPKQEEETQTGQVLYGSNIRRSNHY
jgi:hypothetical protein